MCDGMCGWERIGEGEVYITLWFRRVFLIRVQLFIHINGIVHLAEVRGQPIYCSSTLLHTIQTNNTETEISKTYS